VPINMVRLEIELGWDSVMVVGPLLLRYET